MIKKILAVLSAIGMFFSAIFFILFKQAKEEQKAEKKENEELKEKSNDNTLDGFNALNSLLQK